MVEEKRLALRKQIEEDLNSQLATKEISGSHYKDLVRDYLSLWDIKNSLIKEISTTGIQVHGMHGSKSNPSINDLHKTNDRMLKVLDALGLKASAGENKNSYSTHDLL